MVICHPAVGVIIIIAAYQLYSIHDTKTELKNKNLNKNDNNKDNDNNNKIIIITVL